MPTIRAVPNPVMRDAYLQLVHRVSGVEERVLLEVLRGMRLGGASGLANAPLTDALTKLEPQKIVEVLTKPSPMMAGAVAGITPEQMRDIAVFLTKKTMPAEGSLPEVKAN